jgi:hypothetical protein
MQRRSVLSPALSAVLALLCAVFPATARATAGNAAPESQVSAVMQRLIANPQTPEQYSADVKLHVRLRVFPWISLTVQGNEVYKHPGFYHFVFRGVPKAAEHFSDMAYDLGETASWPRKYDIAMLTPAAPGSGPVLRLIPKVHGMTKTLDVTVDPEKGRIEKAVWARNDGGTIAITQRYDSLGTHEIVAQQDASIRLPHMAADIVATYSNFATQETVSLRN